VLTFPTHLFNPARTLVRPAGSTLEGGESLAGESDTIRTDGGGYWVVSFLGIELVTPDLIRAWRAWEDELQQGVTKVLVPIADIRLAPRPLVGKSLAVPSDLKPTTAELYFPEAVGFSTPLMAAKITDAAALRATQVNIDVLHGSRLKGGEMFTIDHDVMGHRIYRVGRVLSRDGQEATVKITPPLREAIDADTNIDFDWPVVVGKLVPENDISPEIAYGRHATVSITFREAF
jgi:hypothetical protein